MRKGLLVLVMIFLLSGCAGKKDNWDLQQTAQMLLDQGKYETEFVLLDQDQVEGMLPGIEECSSEVAAYESSSEIMNEIIVVRSQDMDEVQKIIRERHQYLLKESENYFPEQVAMIEKAVMDIHGDRLVFVISSDPEQIKQLIEQIDR